MADQVMLEQGLGDGCNISMVDAPSHASSSPVVRTQTEPEGACDDVAPVVHEVLMSPGQMRWLPATSGFGDVKITEGA